MALCGWVLGAGSGPPAVSGWGTGGGSGLAFGAAGSDRSPWLWPGLGPLRGVGGRGWEDEAKARWRQVALALDTGSHPGSVTSICSPLRDHPLPPGAGPFPQPQARVPAVTPLRSKASSSLGQVLPGPSVSAAWEGGQRSCLWGPAWQPARLGLVFMPSSPLFTEGPALFMTCRSLSLPGLQPLSHAPGVYASARPPAGRLPDPAREGAGGGVQTLAPAAWGDTG